MNISNSIFIPLDLTSFHLTNLEVRSITSILSQTIEFTKRTDQKNDIVTLIPADDEEDGGSLGSELKKKTQTSKRVKLNPDSCAHVYSELIVTFFKWVSNLEAMLSQINLPEDRATSKWSKTRHDNLRGRKRDNQTSISFKEDLNLLLPSLKEPNVSLSQSPTKTSEEQERKEPGQQKISQLLRN